MSNYYREKMLERLMKSIKDADGGDLAYFYKVICQCNINEEDAHYQHDEIVDEIETELANMEEEEIAGIIDFLGINVD